MTAISLIAYYDRIQWLEWVMRSGGQVFTGIKKEGWSPIIIFDCTGTSISMGNTITECIVIGMAKLPLPEGEEREL